MRTKAQLGFCLAWAVWMLTGVGAVDAATDWDDISWFEDASGYAEAVADAESSGKPVLVYFYTHWCPYCRQLNQSLLADAVVQSAVGEMLAVRVNAELGQAERSLASHYRVRGYPALFVYSSTAGGSYQAIRRTVGNSPPRLKTPAEFVATLRAASGSARPRAGSR